MTRKTFLLDTNILIHDPKAFEQFPNCDVVISITVIEELDHFKKNRDELGYAARQAIRLLDELRTLNGGNLSSGVHLSNGCCLRIMPNSPADRADFFAGQDNDGKIIALGRSLQQDGAHVVFVTKDLAARIKALALGLQVRDYETDKVSVDLNEGGFRKAPVPKLLIDLCFKDGFLSLEVVSNSVANDWLEQVLGTKRDPHPNEHFFFTCGDNHILCRFDAQKRGWRKVRLPLHNFWGLVPRGIEQQCAVDLLLDDEIKLVTILGPAGTGKTLIALACGLRKTFDEDIYSKLLVSRPIVPLGRDIGYLPGTKEEKLTPWMQPIHDNLEFLCDSINGSSSDAMQWVLQSRKLEMEAVTYIRGRSLPKMYIIIDEAQNLTPHEIKTLVSRAGKGSKVILTGDPSQIDNPYLDRDSNGLSYCVSKFKDQSICGHVVLQSIERSELAALATRIL